MDERLHALAGSQSGAFSAGEALAIGCDERDLHRSVRVGELVRVRRGAYVSARVWGDADEDERYRLTCLAVARSRPGDVLSHHAALAVHGLPLWDHDPGRIDLLSSTRQAVRRGSVWLHPATGVTSADVGGLAAVSPARAVVRSALTMGRDCAVVAGDAALHRGLVDPAELVAEVARVSPHEGRRRAMKAVLSMDGRAESVGESRTRLVLDDLGLAHDSQVVITDSHGEFVARVDFLVDGVVLEFDGRLKYGRARDEQDEAATDPSQVLWLEKRREDRVRRLGHPFERVVWGELTRPGLIGARIRAARSTVVGASHRPTA